MNMNISSVPKINKKIIVKDVEYTPNKIKVNDLLKGKIDNLPEARSRMISIFLSSTFSGIFQRFFCSYV